MTAANRNYTGSGGGSIGPFLLAAKGHHDHATEAQKHHGPGRRFGNRRRNRLEIKKRGRDQCALRSKNREQLLVDKRAADGKQRTANHKPVVVKFCAAAFKSAIACCESATENCCIGPPGTTAVP